MIARGVLAFVLLVSSTTVQAEVYKWVDSDGKSHFSDHPPASNQNNSHVEMLQGIPKSIQDRIHAAARTGISISNISGKGRQCVITGESATHSLTVGFVGRLQDEGIGELLAPLPEDKTVAKGAEIFELRVLLTEELITWAKSQR